MKLLRLAFAAALLAVPSVAQPTLNIVTPSGVVPRVPVPLFIPRCPTTANPYYFSITGNISVPPAPFEDIYMYVRPTLLDGSLIPGCNWVRQCQVAFVLPDNSYIVFGQYGGNDTPRPFFAGQQADVQFVLVDRSVAAPQCSADPTTFAVASSNIITVSTDPTVPALHDFEAPCSNTRMDVQGIPTPGELLTWSLPSAGGVIIGPQSFRGFPVLGCTAFFGFPVDFIPTDGSGTLNLRLPPNASLIGVDLGSQGALIAGGTVDLTQPTLLQIR